jgi:hypothetical protein
LLAIYAVALTAILSVAAPQTAGAAVDPFSVICHSGTDTAAATTEKSPAQHSPAKACDHCTLCNAAPIAAIAFDGYVIGVLTPAKPPRTARPAVSVSHDDIGGSPKQAQGPPQLT